MHRRDAGQLWRVTGDLRVESELVDHCDGQLSEDGDCCFDCYGVLARHVSPVEVKVSLAYNFELPARDRRLISLTSQ